MEHSTFSPGRSTSTSTAAASADQHNNTLPIVENPQDGDVKTDCDPASLEDKMEKLKVQSEKRKRIYETADTVIETLNQLSEIIKAKHQQNEAIIELYDAMVETYKITVTDEALKEVLSFSELFDKVVRQSEECYVFLSNYMFKGRLCQVMDFWNTPQMIAGFQSAFEQLKKQFIETNIQVTTVTVINTQKAVESLERENTLRPLQPSMTLLGPKSHCLEGTRRSSLSKIVEWCFNGEQSILWISGIAGCGKSSLIGTLHNSLSTLGFRSRLAAFIRFDRNDYNKAGEFVKTLAFLLATFDERFGKPVAEVVERSRQLAQNTDLSMQVQKLLINPLRGLSEEIAKEGRIVVLVDGIDECSRGDQAETNFREQLLELFASDRFGLLPFLRFVLASRPEEDIIRSLQHRGHIHHFPLDHTSFETTNDIHYFLTKSFQRTPFDCLDETRKSSAIALLAERASGLFVWAATVIKFIGESVLQRLEIFTRAEPPKNALHALTILYKTSLESLVREGDDDIRQNICMALGLTIVAPGMDNDVACNLRGILQMANRSSILNTFGKLQSLVPETRGGFELLHKSFDDFLTSDQAHQWFIDVETFRAALMETAATCIMVLLDKANQELKEVLSCTTYRDAILWPQWRTKIVDISRHPDLYKALEIFLLRYVIRWLHSFDTDLSDWTGSVAQTEQPHRDSEFMQKAITGASRLGQIGADPIVVKDFFNIMLHDAALAGKVTKPNTDGQFTLEWEIDNIYMSVFILMAGGSNVYEEIVAVLDTNPIPPVVSLDPETEMPIKIVSRGKIRMNHGSVVNGDEESTTEFIEWIPGRYGGRKGILQWIPNEAGEEDSKPLSSESRNSESEE
ncbi:hypothetical protein VNI00_019027 [Paramarasmius palmivorus]|uniref:NACHT domain-containing protein n=1 Tax=Paramarasmius palmivorus TaxID=297713 RepID=A0AAW0AS87_9AGAR